MKCQSCMDDNCQRNYRKRYRCDDDETCTCTCGEPTWHTLLKGVVSIVGGAAAVAGGVYVTVRNTEDVIAALAGSALVGAGFMAINCPVQKKISGEYIASTDAYIIDLAIGAGAGFIAESLAEGGARVKFFLLERCSDELSRTFTQDVCHLFVEIAGGMAASVIQEKFDPSREDKEFKIGNVVRGSVLSGLSALFIYNRVTTMNQDPAQSISQIMYEVISESIASVGMDVVYQIWQTGKMDRKQLVPASFARLATSIAFYACKLEAYKASGGEKIMMMITPDLFKESRPVKWRRETTRAVSSWQIFFVVLPSAFVALKQTYIIRLYHQQTLNSTSVDLNPAG